MPQRLKKNKKNVSLYGLIVEKNSNSFWMTEKVGKTANYLPTLPKKCQCNFVLLCSNLYESILFERHEPGACCTMLHLICA